MEITNSKVQILGNIVVVTLEDEEIQDNYQYEIRLSGFKSKDGTKEINLNHKIVTNLTPSYCKISDVAILIDIYDIPESTILYYIREASKYVDYIRNSNATTTEITFPMTEFVKTKVMLDCLLKAYVSKAAGAGIKGKLGDISFENTEKYAMSIGDLIDKLKEDLKKWEEALKGYEREGRVAPRFAILSSETTDNTLFNNIANDISRDLPVT